MKNLGLACCLAFLALQANSVHAQPGLEKQVAIQKVDDLQPIIQDLSMELWNFSEIALEEVRSAQLLADVLEKEGFSVERGVADMPTAFVASWGQGGPVIGILAEYDALPNIGNAPVPQEHARWSSSTFPGQSSCSAVRPRKPWSARSTWRTRGYSTASTSRSTGIRSTKLS
jgi:hypothetical protein